MEEKEWTKERLEELARRSYDSGRFTFTTFLSMAELSDFYEIEHSLHYAGPKVWGGSEAAERAVIRFGDPESMGYEEEFPIAILEITPLADKFADDLSHRDFLGALMNLGINRNTLGDIFVRDKHAYLFCRDTMVDYIRENLTRVRHTTVQVRPLENIEELPKPVIREQTVQMQSLRIDAVIAKAYNMSRQTSLELFPRGLVFLNGRICTENSKSVKTGDVISVRGYGKMVLAEVGGLSKKGKLNVVIGIYV